MRNSLEQLVTFFRFESAREENRARRPIASDEVRESLAAGPCHGLP